MNRRRMVAVLRAWDTLELMSPEYVTRDFGGAFFPVPDVRHFFSFVRAFRLLFLRDPFEHLYVQIKRDVHHFPITLRKIVGC